MPELDEVLVALQQSNDTMAEIEGELTDLRVEIGNLPDKYVGRDEARAKANIIRKWITGLLLAGLTVAVSAMIGWNVNSNAAEESTNLAEKSLANCEATREGFREVIEKAVTNPVTREMLLSVDGTKPELCR